MSYNLISKSGCFSGVKYVEGTREEITAALQFEISYKSIYYFLQSSSKLILYVLDYHFFIFYLHIYLFQFN